MIEFMNLEMTKSLNFGSGLTSRLSALCRRDIAFFLDQTNLPFANFPRRSRLRGPLTQRGPLLGPLCSVFGAPLLAVSYALRVKHAADDVIAHARQVLDATASDHDHGVLLQVVTFARDVADHLKAVGQPDLGDLAQRRVGFLRRRGVDACAHPALLWARFHVARLFAVGLLRPRFADQLLNG